MDLSTGALLAVVGVMALNQLVMRVWALTARRGVFWSLQGLNMAAGAAVIWWGLPGFERWPAVSWMLGLFFFYRTVENTNSRAAWLREERGAGGRALDGRAQALAEALRRGEEE
ncbi:MAG: hypothetical protein JXX28_15695 [Deltaproteobacteria bacterium]|nr:hypothetical protein [Deltaproteobacteria bacterium]